jgi:hypothetical protein
LPPVPCAAAARRATLICWLLGRRSLSRAALSPAALGALGAIALAQAAARDAAAPPAGEDCHAAVWPPFRWALGMDAEELHPACLGLEVGHALTHLDLSRCGLTDEGAAGLLDAIQQSGHMGLKALALQDNALGDGAAAALGGLLLVSPRLTELNIAENEIGDEGLSALAAALGTACHVRSLTLHGNPIGVDGAAALGDALSRHVCWRLTSLHLTRARAVLRVVDVRGEGDAALSAVDKEYGCLETLVIAALLAHNTSLRSLELDHNPLCSLPRIAVASADAGKKKRRLLRGGGGDGGGDARRTCSYSFCADGLLACAAALASSTPALTSLSLVGCGVTSDVARALGVALRANSILRSLKLSYDRILEVQEVRLLCVCASLTMSVL